MNTKPWPPRSLNNEGDAQTIVLKQSWYLIAGIIALGAVDEIFPALRQVLERAIHAHDMEREP